MSSSTGHEAEHERMSLVQLPDECITYILSHLPLAALGMAGRTCSGLRALANEPELWRRLCVEVWRVEPQPGHSGKRLFCERFAAYRNLTTLGMRISKPSSNWLTEAAADAALTNGADASVSTRSIHLDLHGNAAQPILQEIWWTGSEQESDGETVGVAELPMPLPEWPVGVPTLCAHPNYRAPLSARRLNQLA